MSITEGLVFVAKRVDGLGERLRAILNAIALSKVYNADFCFCWDEERFNTNDHSIGNVSEIFSNNFINSHLKSFSEVSSSRSVHKFFDCNQPGFFHCPQNITFAAFKKCPEDFYLFKNELKKAFFEIEFSQLIKDVYSEAKEVVFKRDCIGLHLRAGDLIYSNYYKNSFSYLNKAIAYPIAHHIVSSEVSHGKQVIIFGQDVSVINALTKFENTISAHDLAPENLSRVEAAFFDIFVMSKCKNIYCGSSGFALLVGMAFDSECVMPELMIDSEDYLNIIENKVFEDANSEFISKEQISFALKKALVVCLKTSGFHDHERLIALGKKVDPLNVVYDFFDIWFDFKNGNEVVADNKLTLIFHDYKFKKFLKSSLSTASKYNYFTSVFDPVLIEDYINKKSTRDLYKSLTKRK